MKNHKISDLLQISYDRSRLYIDYQDSNKIKPLIHNAQQPSWILEGHSSAKIISDRHIGKTFVIHHHKDQSSALAKAGIFYSLDLQRIVYLEHDDYDLWGHLACINIKGVTAPDYLKDSGIQTIIDKWGQVGGNLDYYNRADYSYIEYNYLSGHTLNVYDIKDRGERLPYYDKPEDYYYEADSVFKVKVIEGGQIVEKVVTSSFYRALNFGRKNQHPILGDFVPMKASPLNTEIFLTLETFERAGYSYKFGGIEARFITINQDTREYKYLKTNANGEKEIKSFYTNREIQADIRTATAGGRIIGIETEEGGNDNVNFQYIAHDDLHVIQQRGTLVRFANIETIKHLYPETLIYFCTHCRAWRVDSENGGRHNPTDCARRNFVNERFDYHSRKPKARNVGGARFLVGVEIEKECWQGGAHHCNDIRARFGWIKERDGSLDSHIGYELVSPKFSLMNDSLIKEAEQIEAQFNGLINGKFSSSCGGHIHFSEREKSGRDLLKNVCGYLPLFYAIYSKRIGKTYCQAKEKNELLHSGEKYQAVKVFNDRIEWRIFPAVKNLDTLRWRLDFLKIIATHQTSDPVKVVNMLLDKRTELHKHFLKIFNKGMIYERAKNALQYAQKYDADFYNIDLRKGFADIDKQAKKDNATAPRSRSISA